MIDSFASARNLDEAIHAVEALLPQIGKDVRLHHLYRAAIDRRSADLLEAVSAVSRRRGLMLDVAVRGSAAERSSLCALLAEALEGDWHVIHEDLVMSLEDLRHVDAVAPLHRAVFAKPPVLDEIDGADALSRKAVWAMGKLVLPVRAEVPIDPVAKAGAVRVLRDLAACSDPVVAERAQSQFRRFAARGIILDVLDD